MHRIPLAFLKRTAETCGRTGCTPNGAGPDVISSLAVSSLTSGSSRPLPSDVYAYQDIWVCTCMYAYCGKDTSIDNTHPRDACFLPGRHRWEVQSHDDWFVLNILQQKPSFSLHLCLSLRPYVLLSLCVHDAPLDAPV